jgi:hypothetical protein
MTRAHVPKTARRKYPTKRGETMGEKVKGRLLIIAARRIRPATWEILREADGS